MLKIKNNILTIAVVLFVFTISMFLTACGGVKEGEYTENGLKFQVKNNSATVVGIEDNVTEVSIPSKFKGLSVAGIKENAFENSKVKKVAFNEEIYSNFYISENVFNNSDVENIENLPANASLDYRTFEGIKNLKSISVYGDGKYKVENGALVEISGDVKNLKLVPSAAIPQANFENGTYTISGYYTVSQNAFANNKFITDVVIGEGVKYVNENAFANINLNSVTIQNTNKSDLFIDDEAFTVHKNLKIFVPATTNQEMKSWLSYSKNFVYSYNWIVHPVGCTDNTPHIHGLRGTMVNGSLEGYSYNPSEETVDFEVGSYLITGVKVPDYVK